MKFNRAVLTAIATIWITSLPAAAQVSNEPPRAIGNAFDWNDGAELQWFDLWSDQMRFTVDPRDREQLDQLAGLVVASAQEGRALQVFYDPSRARLSAAGDRVEYPVCRAVFEERKFESRAVCAGAVPPASASSPETALAWGIALADSSRPLPAISLLDQLLASKASDPRLVRIALATRAAANSALGYQEPADSLSSDRRFLAALRDYQKLDTMRSPSSESRLDTGIILEELGDYDGAEAQYNAIPRASEGDDFRATIRLAAVARARGQLDRSLELINGLAVRHGPQTGMRYHYHRGWTLNALGRFDEAIVDFTAGLETQPDYYWAYLRRACAYAGSGRLEYALSDLESGMAILRRTYGDRTPETRGDSTRALEIQSMLKNKLAAGDSAPSADACGGYPHDRSKARAKSPLLG